jgi:hypothetical protein
VKIANPRQTRTLAPLKPHSLVAATRPGGGMADAGGLNPPDWKRSYGFESRPGHKLAQASALASTSGLGLALVLAGLRRPKRS